MGGPRWRAVARWLILGAVVGAGVILYRFDPSASTFFPRCALHELTGLHCPGCGATRAVHHLLHGRVAAAFRFHPLLVVLLPAIVGGVMIELGWVRRRRPIPSSAVYALLGVVVLFGIARNLPFEPFTRLAPR